MKKYILAIDQGTTGSRAFVVNDKGFFVSSAYKEFRQYYPKPGWVEHDAEEIWESVVFVIGKVLRLARVNKGSVVGIGITNQRETSVLWHRKNGKPIHRAIVWQCRRTAPFCDGLKKKGVEKKIRQKTGLVLDPYFSASKVKWILDQKSGLRAKAKSGAVCFGTIDSWLIFKLTGGEAHVTDMTNASRTMLLNIVSKKWDEELLEMFRVPKKVLPVVKNSGDEFGFVAEKFQNVLPAGIPILSVMGDQQAALYGQGCHEAGSMKNTYGTGAFMVMNTGKARKVSSKGLLTTLASDVHGNPVYALEGAIFIAGALMQWLRDGLGVLKKASDSEAIARSVKDTAGVYFVPAFVGLGAPYWNAEARGLITGLTRGATKAHVIRAALESIAYQTRDVYELMMEKKGSQLFKMGSDPFFSLNVDGGASANDFLMQFQADILGAPVFRPQEVETTVRGVALLAGLKAGIWSVKDIKAMQSKGRVFKPKMNRTDRNNLYTAWNEAVNRAL